MVTVHAYAALEENGPLVPYEYELGELRADDIDIAVESCGICHSDLSMLENEWGITRYPLVPGHEVIGKVKAVGDHVHHLSVGDRVGLGWHSAYCMTCDECMGGHHNLCPSAELTLGGRHGGFADIVRAHSASATKLPSELASGTAGPLLCAGITVYGPFEQMDISPSATVGVIGIGGLGHLALKFARAWGCRVVAFTSPGKTEEALELGAHQAINSRDADAIKAEKGRFDLILSTVNVNLDWNAYMRMLRPRGRLHMVGAVAEPLSLNLTPMMFGQLSLSSSPVGDPATMRRMLEFAARHDITPVNEHYPMSKVNDAMERLRSGEARYRIVLDRDGVH